MVHEFARARSRLTTTCSTYARACARARMEQQFFFALRSDSPICYAHAPSENAPSCRRIVLWMDLLCVARIFEEAMCVGLCCLVRFSHAHLFSAQFCCVCRFGVFPPLFRNLSDTRGSCGRRLRKRAQLARPPPHTFASRFGHDLLASKGVNVAERSFFIAPGVKMKISGWMDVCFVWKNL